MPTKNKEGQIFYETFSEIFTSQLDLLPWSKLPLNPKTYFIDVAIGRNKSSNPSEYIAERFDYTCEILSNECCYPALPEA